jgi:hypothetical protein
MDLHQDYKYSVTIHTDYLAIVNCLRALSQFSQKSGNNRIPWGNTKDSDWRKNNNSVTFPFSTLYYREVFMSEIKRLLPINLWNEIKISDNDPASKTR